MGSSQRVRPYGRVHLAMALHDPVTEGGITMRPVRFSDQAALSHEPQAEPPAPSKKTRAPRKPKEG
jgi:hypothetical protein